MDASKACGDKNVFVVVGMVLVNFLSGTCVSLLAPFFPELASKKGVSSAVTGMIFGFFPLMRVVLSPLFGHFSLLQAAFSAGITIGPPLGGVLYEFGGYGLPFYVTGGTLTVDAVFCWLTLSNVEGSSNENSMSSWKSLMHGHILIIGSSVSVIIFCKTFYDPILTPHLKQVFSSIFMLTGLVLTTLAYLLIGPAPFFTFLPPSVGLIIFSLCLIGMAEALIFGPAFRCICKLTQEYGAPDDLDTYGIVSSFIGSCLSTGLLFGPVAAGALFDAYGFEWATFYCSVFSASFCLAVLLYIVFDRLKAKMQFRKNKLEEKGSELNLVEHSRLDLGYTSISPG